jgi:hypothetical protein
MVLLVLLSKNRVGPEKGVFVVANTPSPLAGSGANRRSWKDRGPATRSTHTIGSACRFPREKERVPGWKSA